MGFWEGVDVEEGVGVDRLDDVKDRESWWIVSVWGCYNRCCSVMRLSSSCDICVWSSSLLSDGLLVRGDYMGVTYEMGEGGERGSFLTWEWIGWKGGWENVGGLGSELANLSAVSISELLNWEIVLYTVVLELVSDSMLGEMLWWWLRWGENQKVGRWGSCPEGWLGGKLIDGGIQFGGSSWAKNMVTLRTKSSGVWLFYILFICVVYVGLLVIMCWIGLCG